jgi:hypothetical protein
MDVTKITKHDTINFEIFARGVKGALDGFHDAFIKEYIQKEFTDPDDVECITHILDDYREGFKRTLDGIDAELNRRANIKLDNGNKE